MSRKSRYRHRLLKKLVMGTLGIALVLGTYGFLGQQDRHYLETAKAEYYASR